MSPPFLIQPSEVQPMQYAILPMMAVLLSLGQLSAAIDNAPPAPMPPIAKAKSVCPACGCGCVESGSCQCKNCNTHTADPKSPDYVPPKTEGKTTTLMVGCESGKCRPVKVPVGSLLTASGAIIIPNGDRSYRFHPEHQGYGAAAASFTAGTQSTCPQCPGYVAPTSQGIRQTGGDSGGCASCGSASSSRSFRRFR